jgi:hypothetical protein
MSLIMTQEQVNLILGVLTLLVPTATFVIRDWWRKRKNTITYGDNLLEAMNKTTESLKQARSEISAMDVALRQMDKTHEEEITDLQHQHKRERERLRGRIQALEKVLVRYDISFTLTTHPDVKVENLRVVGKDTMLTDTDKMKAVTQEQIEQNEKLK